ncbi:HAD-like domain-containing protein [Emericellopsis atlantica]|uniref:HAD-like domain-containing protein n=1 Tax=Emericellopsis atlantica TaxID=2614577 RepID=A0A9P8CRB7_9HYPO|nr:HAD-like domain-containing protein [Emericellopsis atlantica]KAG9254551.1 HAD-like domain-containing protein [Emericellopsis atlantica]
MSPSLIHPLSSIKALTFDVFGTVVNWRLSVVDELSLRAHRKLNSLPDDAPLRDRLSPMDWSHFAQQWRDTYGRFTKGYDPERDTWKSVDQHHRDSLVELLREYRLEDLYTDAEITSLSLVWHRLTPWDDSSAGIQTLNSQHIITSTLSNGNTSLLQDLADFGSLPFQHLLSAEIFKAYKPNPATYRGAARALGVDIGEVAMVAAHLNDLKAARDCGMKTIYVQRAQEEAWSEDDERYKDAKNWVDMWVSQDEGGFEEVARRLSEVR